jgi:hypothetical protein
VRRTISVTTALSPKTDRRPRASDLGCVGACAFTGQDALLISPEMTFGAGLRHSGKEQVNARWARHFS